jgi:hypothetical protein
VVVQRRVTWDVIVSQERVTSARQVGPVWRSADDGIRDQAQLTGLLSESQHLQKSHHFLACDFQNSVILAFRSSGLCLCLCPKVMRDTNPKL